MKYNKGACINIKWPIWNREARSLKQGVIRTPERRRFLKAGLFAAAAVFRALVWRALSVLENEVLCVSSCSVVAFMLPNSEASATSSGAV